MITRWARPVTSSICSRIVTSSTMSRNTTVPPPGQDRRRERIPLTSSLPGVTRPPSLTLILAPGTTGYISFSRPRSSSTISPFRFSTTMSHAALGRPGGWPRFRTMTGVSWPRAWDFGFQDTLLRRAADVERTMVSWVPGSADGLGRDDPPPPHPAPPDGRCAGCARSTGHADAPLGLAGQRRADAHALEARVLDLLGTAPRSDLAYWSVGTMISPVNR